MEYLIEGIVQAIKLITSLDPYVMSVVKVQLQVSLSAVLLASATAVPLAILFSFKNFPGKSFLLAIINTSMGLPPVVVGLIVFVLFMHSSPLGFLNLLYTRKIMILAQYILAMPIILGVSIAAINSVPSEIRETAYTLGATQMQVARVVLRESAFGILTAVVAGAGRVFAEVGAILTVGGNIAYTVVKGDEMVKISSTRTLSTAIPLETSQGDIATAIAFGIILLSISFALNLLMAQLQKREEHEGG